MFGKAPDFIKDAPQLYFWLDAYYEAFGSLSSCRPVDGFSGSIGRIPWTAVNDYAKRYPFADNDFEVFTIYISALDEKLMQLVRDKPAPPPRKPKEK